MINNQSDVRVGSYISEIIVATKFSEIFNIRITISNHNLAKGRYRTIFGVGLKDVTVGLKDFDVVHNVLSFEVVYVDYITKIPIALWKEDWGNSNYTDGVVEII